MCSVRTATPFGSFVDLTSSIIRWRPKGTKISPRFSRGVGILARPKTGGKLAVFTPIYLTSVRPVAENDRLFLGSGKSPRLNQIGLSTASKGTLVAEVFA
jgi:hypothetical protein